MYGIMLGDGNISSVNNLAYVALNKDTKIDTIEFVENYLSKMNIHITYTCVNDKYVRLTWTRTNMFKFTYEMLYDENKEKNSNIKFGNFNINFYLENFGKIKFVVNTQLGKI